MKNWRGTLEAHVTNWVEAVPDKWVPRYIYHFTDVQNAAIVIQSGELLSRTEAVARDVMRNDNAASSVIENTPAAHKQFARLYFRPRTPTQYRAEGIRPPSERYHGAHCPVPVFLAFDLIETILQDGVSFSDGNMASGRVLFNDSEQFFRSLPFRLIYHDGPFSAEQRDEIVFHRHAEVLVPRSLTIAPTLKWILCRSYAERETLLHLLGTSQSRWEPIVKVGDQKLFYGDRFYVERVEVTATPPRVTFQLKVPFGKSARVRFRLTSPTSGKVWTWNSDSWSSPVLPIDLRDAEAGIVHLWIEDCLAYTALVSYADVPF
jgi:ssDNA thymidine ADP-ribosyltransferase, DarT